jgi:uncharacterized coiled-coil protein SlyX
MENSRIDRKRAYDRQAQRANRAKNRAYIEHLESTIAELTQGGHEDRLAYLSSCALEKDRKIESLQEALMKIKTALQDVQPSAAEEAAPAISDHSLERAEIRFSDTSSWNPQLIDNLLPDNAAKHIRSNPKQPALEIDTVDMEQASQTENYFKVLNDALTKLEHSVDPGSLSAAADDEDIAIRSVISGWDTAAQQHRLDPIWGFLRELDEAIYWRSGPAERIVILRLTRAMLLYKIHPPHQPRRSIPPFMAPTVLQRTCTYPALVNLFAWPGFRDYLIQNGIRSISTGTAANFANNFRFVWPYEVCDLYLTLKASGHFTFSEAFTYRFNRLDSYRVTPWEEVTDLARLGLTTTAPDSSTPDTTHLVDGTHWITSRPSDVVDQGEDEWSRFFEGNSGALSS